MRNGPRWRSLDIFFCMHPFRLLIVLSAAATAIGSAPVDAQDSARVLPTVRVTTTREGPRASLELPYALTSASPHTLSAARRQGIDELLVAIPGVALASRQNPAQDPRVSIRGFGARSAFGVRGVRVLQDGIPVTLPDGQTPVDVLDLEGADRVEVIRGSASSLYGNAAGGVIDVRSRMPALRFTPFARIVVGSSTPLIAAAGASGSFGELGATSSITRIAGRGYRDHSNQRSTRAAGRLMWSPSSWNGTVSLAARVSDVVGAESPGALTRSQMDSAPRMADPLSVRKGAGKTVRQGDLALTVARAFGDRGAVDASVYASARTLDNPLTFAIVDVRRSSGGASLRGHFSSSVLRHPVRLAGGGDLQWQNDDRQEFESCIGATCPGGATVRGALRKDQRELVASAGPFARAELSLRPSIILSGGVRSDVVRFRVRDRLVSATNPDDSGERTLHALSPSLGIVWRVATLASVYANVSRSFETPTTTELGNTPDGSAGINPDLAAQRTLSVEIGAKGALARGLRWDAAAFQTRASDELVPFDIPGGAGRRYFRNAGRTLRRGAELGLEGERGPFTARAAWSCSHFRYGSYAVGTESFAGRRIPGVPASAVAALLGAHVGRFLLSGTADIATAVDVDDANTAQAAGRTLIGAAVSTTIHLAGASLSPLIGLQNIADVRTVGSVSVNATGGKFYEPAPRRTLVVRLTGKRD